MKSLLLQLRWDMAARKTKRKRYSSRSGRGAVANRPAVQAMVSIDPAVVPKPVTDVITEKTYVTTEPEIEIRETGDSVTSADRASYGGCKTEDESSQGNRNENSSSRLTTRSSGSQSLHLTLVGLLLERIDWARLFPQPMYVRQRLICRDCISAHEFVRWINT